MKKHLIVFALSAFALVSGFGRHTAWAQLYAVDFASQNLYTVSTSNAALTLVGNTGQSLGSLEYRPSNGFLYGFTVGSGASCFASIRQTPTRRSSADWALYSRAAWCWRRMEPLTRRIRTTHQPLSFSRSISTAGRRI